VISPFIAATLVRTCDAVRIETSLREKSCAKSSASPFGVNLMEPLLSGRSSVPIGVGRLMMRTKADSPLSEATADADKSGDLGIISYFGDDCPSVGMSDEQHRTVLKIYGPPRSKNIVCE
jgi:hypothetical protein